MKNDFSLPSRRFFLQGAAGSVFLPAAQSLTAGGQPNPRHHVEVAASVRFGVNYVPRTNWFYGWQDWELPSVQEDLRAIADLGFDHIRAHLLWPFFQPGENYVSEVMVDRLLQMLDAADAAGLDVEVTVLNGWMSGLSFLPAWVQPLEPKRNLFTSPVMLEAEELLFQTLGTKIGAHRRFLGFDLGNELPVLQTNSQAVTSAEADSWASRMLGFCERIAPGKLHVNGVDHKPWFRDFGFTRGDLANTGALTILHCYGLFTGAVKKFGALGKGSLGLAEYMTEFAYAYQHDLTRKVWIEEIGVAGVAPQYATEDQLPAYMDALVRKGWKTGKLWGITWWGSHDINPAIRGFAPLEYTLGLLDQKNRPKPLGRKFASLAEELRRTPVPTPLRPTALVVPDVGLGVSAPGPDWSYGEAFFKLAGQGKSPGIVLESRAGDEAYLRSRGFRELIPLRDVKG